MRRAARWRGAVHQRRSGRGARQPRISPAVLTVAGAMATLRIERKLQTPNHALWAHWHVKRNDRQAWEASIRHALVCHLDDQARTRADREAVGTVALATGPLPRAPEGRYTVTVERIVPSARHFIRDDDNLTYSVKPVLDALTACGLIYDDSREWLDRPLPTQRAVPGTTATVLTIQPWWRAMPPAAQRTP